MDVPKERVEARRGEWAEVTFDTQDLVHKTYVLGIRFKGNTYMKAVYVKDLLLKTCIDEGALVEHGALWWKIRGFWCFVVEKW